MALLSVLVQLVLSTQTELAKGDSIFGGIWSLTGYFTMWTNFILGLLMLRMSGSATNIASSINQSAIAFITLQIAVVAIIFNVLLRDYWHPEGLALITDHFFHIINPALMFLFWLFLAPKEKLRFKHPILWLAYPLFYCVCAMLRGAATGWYPYPFLDVSKIGYQGVGLWALALTSLFWGLGSAMVAYSHRFSNASRDKK